MRGPGGPAGLQNRFTAVIRPRRFDSPAFREWRFKATGFRKSRATNSFRGTVTGRRCSQMSHTQDLKPETYKAEVCHDVFSPRQRWRGQDGRRGGEGSGAADGRRRRVRAHVSGDDRAVAEGGVAKG